MNHPHKSFLLETTLKLGYLQFLKTRNRWTNEGQNKSPTTSGKPPPTTFHNMTIDTRTMTRSWWKETSVSKIIKIILGHRDKGRSRSRLMGYCVSKWSFSFSDKMTKNSLFFMIKSRSFVIRSQKCLKKGGGFQTHNFTFWFQIPAQLWKDRRFQENDVFLRIWQLIMLWDRVSKNVKLEFRFYRL